MVRPCAESIIISALCLADMLSTILFVSIGAAGERNPLMAACLSHGIATFVLIKVLSFVPFVLAIEWYRRRNPAFARNAARAAIVLYALIYIVLTAKTNIT